jgi:hypothetical protein
VDELKEANQELKKARTNKKWKPKPGDPVATYRSGDIYFTIRPFDTNLRTGEKYLFAEYTWTVREWKGETSMLVRDLTGRLL